MRLIITGVGKGFGRAYLEHVSKRGEIKEVLAITRNMADFSAEERWEFEALDVTFYQADLIYEKQLLSLISDHEEFFANADILINNAGQRYRRKIEEISWCEIEDLFSVNVYAPMILSKAVMDSMKQKKFGRIINISSILTTSGLSELSAYAATKGAIDSFTKSLAIEVAEFGINVNSIAPGFCVTSYAEKFKENSELNKMVISNTPQRRWGTVNEINGTIDFLMSPQANYITGQTIFVDGGWSAK